MGDNYGHKQPNGTFTGAIGNLERRTSDIILTSFFIKDYGSQDFTEFTASVHSDKLCCLVRNAEKIHPFVLPLIVFDLVMWTYIICVTFICSLLWILLRWLKVRGSGSLNIYFKIFVDGWSVMLSAPINNKPTARSERILMSWICILSLVLVTIFQSNLTTVFIKTPYHKNINTLKELDQKNYKVFSRYKNFMDDAFPENVSTTFRHLNERLEYSDLSRLELTRLIKMSRTSVLERESVYELSMKHDLHLVNECPRRYLLAYLVPKNSIYYDRINALLLRMIAAGITDKLVSDLYFHNSLNKTYIPLENFKRLAMVDLQLPFSILAVCSAISFLVFLMEILLNKHGRKFL